MSGHSKWAQIKRQKGVADQKKGQIFSRLANKITIAARSGVNPTNNYKLKSAIDEARAANMPKDNIERAIKRASEKDAATINKVTIQAIGPGGIAAVVEAVTDNKNRTISEIKHGLAEHDFKMVSENSLNWMFDDKQQPIKPLEATPEDRQKLDKLLETLGGNDDVENVYTNLK